MNNNRKSFNHSADLFNFENITLLCNDYGFLGYGFYFYIIEKIVTTNTNKIPLNEQTLKAISFDTYLDLELVKNIINDCITKYDLLSLDNENNVFQTMFKINLKKGN